ncbi:MAG: isoprenoid biosynthesis glyoxalase ElbB [bacterium]
MAKIGVILSGCGVYDGSEIHEAALTLYFLDRAGAGIICMAPEIDQMHVINHQTGKETGESRSVMAESARIAREAVKNIKDIKAADLDGLILPGGFGAAKNLCNFAVKGSDCRVNDEVRRLVVDMHGAKKPVGFICIAPVIAAKVLTGVEVTIGNDAETASAIEKMGGKHTECGVDGIVVDEANKIITTPAYMLGPTISRVAVGIEKLVAKILEMII